MLFLWGEPRGTSMTCKQQFDSDLCKKNMIVTDRVLFVICQQNVKNTQIRLFVFDFIEMKWQLP